MAEWRAQLAAQLEVLERGMNLRRLSDLEVRQGAEVQLDGQRLLNLSSNDYLGLAGDERLTEAIRQGSGVWGVGGGGARLIAGSATPLRHLEQELAGWKHTQRALLFPSGFQANVGLIPALCGADDLVISDELNHASIIDGCRLSRAQVHVYRHLDLEHLQSILQDKGNSSRRTLVVSETLFSMNGDRLDVPRWSGIAREHGAMTLLDDAHALGVLGEEGQGLASGKDADLIVGTLGKAMGVSGAFVCTDKLLADWIVNRCRSFIFTTAPNMPTCLAALASLRLLRSREGEERRAQLWRNIDRFVAGVAAMDITLPRSHILPIFVAGGQNAAALELSQGLRRAGIHMQAIRPPTVPPGTARLRCTWMATHQPHHVDRVLAALRGQRELLQ